MTLHELPKLLETSASAFTSLFAEYLGVHHVLQPFCSLHEHNRLVVIFFDFLCPSLVMIHQSFPC